jgi:Bacterial regulatory helix-turn-helix protein, lysR family
MTAFDDLSLLRTFVWIVECGSISAGARRLKTPQPTLSRHLLLLEEHCGAALLKGRRFRSDPDEHLVQKNDRFSELFDKRLFPV